MYKYKIIYVFIFVNILEQPSAHTWLLLLVVVVVSYFCLTHLKDSSVKLTVTFTLITNII